MITTLLIAAAVSAPAADAHQDTRDFMNDASHAIAVGRTDQAGIMIGRAIAARASGRELARLLADFAFAKGNFDEALLRYRSLLSRLPNDGFLLERAALAALKLGDADTAVPFLQRVVTLPSASWRAWNANGVVADIQSRWSDADFSYEHARRLAPTRVEPIANQGWSLVLRGNWQAALPFLQRAAAMEPRSARIANNLELVQEALAVELPPRRPNESDASWSERLNDAGVAAAVLGNRMKARAAFTQALEANGSWFQRAANNLEAVKDR